MFALCYDVLGLFCHFWLQLPSKMVENMFKLNIIQNLGVLSFHYKSQSLIAEPWKLFVWFLVIAASKMTRDVQV